MKTLKFSSNQIQDILNKKLTATWRLFDDKKLDVGDDLQFVNRDNGQIFGYGQIVEITIKKISDLTKSDEIGGESFSDKDAIIKTFKNFYGPSVNLESVIKIIRYELKSEFIEPVNQSEPTNKLKEAKMFTDGGSRGNPGPSASAFIILDMDDNVVKKGGDYLGITTNNQAEYQAVRQGLSYAKEMGIRIVHVYLDSLLVVNQMIGVFKIKNRDLWPIHDDIKNLIKQFEKVNFTHVPREMNKIADEQVNKILDSQDMNGLKSELL